MAIMHPLDIENYPYKESEKAIYIALRDQLSEKYHVFYSVRWFDTIDGKRVDSESDFIVFDPSFGYLTIEVKGGKSLSIDGDKWILTEFIDGEESNRQLKCSPYEQAEKSMRHFHDRFFNEFQQSFKGVYGFAVAFPWYSAELIISSSSPKEVTIDMNDMDNLHGKINAIFHYWRNKRNLTIPFSSEQRKRFISLVNQRISLSAAAGALIPIKEKEFMRINAIQDSILDAMHNFRELQFVGGAGTGKTYIGVKKAIRDAKSRGKVLFTCCSKSLASYIKNTLIGNVQNLDCLSFDEVMERTLGSRFHVLKANCVDYIDELTGVKEETKYDSIIVDEAQDFDVNMGLSLRALLRSNNSVLYVFFDDNQNIFSRHFSNSFAIDSPPIILRYNIRNTGRIYDYATSRTGLGTETIASTLLGVDPECYEYSSRFQAIKGVTNIINKLTQREYVPSKSIVVLSNKLYSESILSNEDSVGAFSIDKSENFSMTQDNKIRFSTISSFKGMEADVVIFINQTAPNEILSKERVCESYVALTRARYYLFIINVVLHE